MKDILSAEAPWPFILLGCVILGQPVPRPSPEPHAGLTGTKMVRLARAAAGRHEGAGRAGSPIRVTFLFA